jgi:uncharacterized protein (TIGR03118 family)
MAPIRTPLLLRLFRLMKTIRVPRLFGSYVAALVVSGLQFLSAMFPCANAQADGPKFFDWENLQSDIAGVADRTDPNLVNSWGLALNTKANIFWVADNGSGLSTLYQPDGTLVPLVVTIPPTSADTITPPATTAQAAPTGIVFNTFANAFILKEDGLPAAFIFDGEDGSITAWNGGLNPITSALIRVDNSSPDPTKSSVYKGLALAVRENGGPTLYAANFHNGTVDVFDSKFNPATITGNFKDPNPPAVPQGTSPGSTWAPFDLASIGGHIYVTFALQNDKKHDDVAGPGNGFVDVFNKEGHFIKRLITGGNLNSPWGLARVPDDEHFGKFDDEVLLVGNFGDGHINAYNIYSGAFIETLLRRKDQPLEFNGLWSLFFLTTNFTSPLELLTKRTTFASHGKIGSRLTNSGGCSLI